MKNFTTTESAFYDYLMSRGYARTTIILYVSRLRKVGDIHTLLHTNLDPLIADYKTGAHANLNKEAHGAFSCALQRLQEWQAAEDTDD